MGSYSYIRPAGADCAKAVGRSLPISTKTSKEVCTWVRGKTIARAITMLEQASEQKIAVPYKSAVKDIGHRKGNILTGGFPHKAASHILDVIKNAQTNAENLGLNSKELVVWHIAAQQGPKTMRGGRRYRTAKRTHVEVIVKEDKKTAKSKTPRKKPAAKVAQKPEVKSEVKKVEEKSEPMIERQPRPEEVKKQTPAPKTEVKEEEQKPVEAKKETAAPAKSEDIGAKSNEDKTKSETNNTGEAQK